MRSSPFAVVIALLPLVPLASASNGAPPVTPISYFTEPSVSPTSPEIAFVASGDVWTVSTSGGEARLLVSHPAEEARPLYSPDGSRLAFASTRTGSGDIYILTLATGGLKRLTFSDVADALEGWSRDGKWLYFSASGQDVGNQADIFRVSVDGGTPMAVSADRYVAEFHAAPAPRQDAIAFAARGNSRGQWWRNGHSHIDEAEIWLRREGAEGAAAVYQRLVEDGARNNWPMWSDDGRTLFFMSDRSGSQNLWVRPVGPGQDAAKPRQLTKFTRGRVLWPSISYDGRTIVFERDFHIWKVDASTGAAAEVPITLRGAAPAPAISHQTLAQFGGLALSPDARKLVFTGRGEIFAVAARAAAGAGSDAVRVTTTPAVEGQIEWAPDSRRIVYVSERAGASNVYMYDFTTSTEKQLTRSPLVDLGPRFSPDGRSLLFLRDRKEIRVLDIMTGQDRPLVSGYIRSPSYAWSPDGQWVAYAAVGDKGFRNVYVIPAAGGQSRQISFLSNAQGVSSIAWSPDGSCLIFDTGQRTETVQLARVDLQPRQPRFREDQFHELFVQEPGRGGPPRGDAAGAPADTAPRRAGAPRRTEIVFDGIRERLTLLAVGFDASSPRISPDGKTLLFTGSVANQSNLYTWSLDDLATGNPVARQLTSTAGGKGNAQWTPDSREVYYLEGGRIQAITVESRQARPIAANAELDVDFPTEKVVVFEQAWTALRDNFYDPNFHGVDWNAVRDQYAPAVAGARTPEELRRIISLMLGEMNASHMGISGPATEGERAPVAKLALRFDRAEYERSGRMRIESIVRGGPTAVAGVAVGDYLVSIDGARVGAGISIDSLLERKAGKKVALELASGAPAGAKRTVVVSPIGSEATLLYRQWVEDNRAYVDRISGGKLGYIHIRDMSAEALTQLYMDLDADNHTRKGVVIDIRNNNGGFVNAYALDVLSRRGYMSMTSRGLPQAPARTVLGQRSLELPTVLVTNASSLSDAEDFTEGYRTLKLGKVVGEPTAGWIIYTGSVSLVDGSTLRMPGTRITGADGKDMELNPRPVDVFVQRPIGESYSGRDSQLDAAVKELLAQLGR
jgi:tricorn protease